MNWTISDLAIVEETYNASVNEELGFRGLNLSREDVLRDTIGASVSIISRGVLKGMFFL